LGLSFLGFKQVLSVKKGGFGGEPWRDHTHQPITDHGRFQNALSGFGGTMMTGLLGASLMWGPGMGFQGEFSRGASYLAYAMLGMAMRSSKSYLGGSLGGSQNQHQIAQRQVPQFDNQTAKFTDYSALTVKGSRFSILAFIFLETDSMKVL